MRLNGNYVCVCVVGDISFESYIEHVLCMVMLISDILKYNNDNWSTNP